MSDSVQESKQANGVAARDTAGNLRGDPDGAGNLNGSSQSKPPEQEDVADKRHLGGKLKTTSELDAKKEQTKRSLLARARFAKKQAKDKKRKVTTNFDGGDDEAPMPEYSGDTYTIRFTFHRAENLPVSDLKERASDPYIHATLSTFIPKRHKEDHDLVLRTKTAHKSLNPKWEQQWIVAGIPSQGFRLKCRLYDEDPSDHDDRLGNVTVYEHMIDENWPGIKEQGYDVKKRMGSKRAYALKACVGLLEMHMHMGATLYLSAELLGKTEGFGGRMYTVGPNLWTKHNSAFMGRLAGTKAAHDSEDEGDDPTKPKIEGYDFQANQIQLKGPVPTSLYHRYVEYKPIMKGMFVRTTLRGRLLNSALHHQHRRVYNYSRSTEYGEVEPKSESASKQFLRLAHYDDEGRIFTYVINLDGLFRFTETGKEFGIDILSKHSMHSDVANYVAYSGEFFIRRIQDTSDSTGESLDPNASVEKNGTLGTPPSKHPSSTDPKDYELVIDNDSGTYRPDGALLPDLEKFLSENFPGLHVVTKERSDESLQKAKEERREMRKRKRRRRGAKSPNNSEQ
ncbi:hypothetical protein F5884DRAFT_771724 [Xylogone sp. PMI_703]|nr:hypothetical protein F5884DRAFT_771724 [Xylogone sp. PMI_703]